MAAEIEFPLGFLHQRLDSGLVLSECLFHSDLSRLGGNRERAIDALRRNFEELLPKLEPGEHYRRRLATSATGRCVSFTLDPPRKLESWRDPVRLRFPVVVWQHGEEATLAILGPGECIGDLSMLDGRPRSASAIASQATKTLIVTRDHFRSWLLERPRAALVLLETLSLRVRRTDEALADMAFLDLPHRLIKRLVELANNHPEVHAAGKHSVKLKVTQSELASMLGVSRESVNKQLNTLAKNGSISLGRGSITVKDTRALQAAL